MTTRAKGARKPNGRSSIYFSEADGLWHGWVTMGIKDDGSPDRRHRKGRSETQVTRKIRELEAKRDAGKVDKVGRAPTVAEWMATYLDTVCQRLVLSGKMAPRTLDDYRSKTRLWITPMLGKHRLDRLLPEHLDTAYQKMHEAGLSSSTVLKIHRILSRALTVAVRRDKVARNVAKLIDAPVADEPDTKPLTREEARRILGIAAKRSRNGARWTVALALGIRQGEALGLRWDYVDLETGLIRAWFQIQHAEWQHGCNDPHECGARWHKEPCPTNCKKHRHDEDCQEDCKKKSHRCPRRTCRKDCTGHADHCPQRKGGSKTFRQRKGKRKLTLQCPSELLPILRKHHAAQSAERLKAGDRWEESGLVFCQPNGRSISRTEDWREWKAILKEAGVRDARLHDARHTCGTLLIEQGVHIRVVQEILGHARVTTTERYTHVASPQVQDASERMGSALWG
ncbi:site-specific integrase [Actinoallomurus liliacearum]|uniref:Site-specific integrase n=1 Tax=Actinoallomurus liliacearum TaxID=1080073 RepID=A0ABP8U0Z4_9ACTN